MKLETGSEIQGTGTTEGVYADMQGDRVVISGY